MQPIDDLPFKQVLSIFILNFVNVLIKSGFFPEIINWIQPDFHNNRMATNNQKRFSDPEDIQRFMDMLQSDFEKSDNEATDTSSGMFAIVFLMFFIA